MASEGESVRFAQQVEAARSAYEDPDLRPLVDWILKAAAAVSSADVSAFCLLPKDGEPTWWVSDWHVADLEALGSPYTVASFGPALAGEAIADIRETTLDRDLRRFDLRSFVAVPVQVGEGTVLGLLVVGHRDPDRFSDEDKAGVIALATHLGVALDTRVTLKNLAELEATQRQVVHQLQEAVRPAMIAVPNTELGVSYVPADPQAPTGGDHYDWVVLPDGDVHIAVVDVEGKGVVATKDALTITHAVKFFVLDGVPLGDVVRRTDALVAAQNPDLVATLLVARYSPSTGVVRIAGAGHPPPLLVAGGKVRQIDAPGLPIGYPGAGSESVREITLGRRDILVMYTDGLVEAHKNILSGLEMLARAAQAAKDYPAPHMARDLVHRALRGATRHDDTLALVLRRRTPPPATGKPAAGPFEHRFTPNAATVPLARHFLLDWLIRVPVTPEEAEDLAVVASELCTNAIRAAATSVSLCAHTEGADVVLEVSDDGGGFSWPERAATDEPDPNAEEGRGLFLVEALVDEVTSHREGKRTIVRCRKRDVVG